MNLGIVTSFIIAAILLIAIVAMNINISQSAGGLTLRQISQQNVDAVSEMVSHDIPKIGFNQLGNIPDAITIATDIKLQFKSNIDNSGTTETVTWSFDTTAPITSSENPDDYLLTRTVNNEVTEITLGVTEFEFSYLDDQLKSTNDSDEIRHIKVAFTIESKEKYGNSGQYTQSVWSKTFTPKNIK